MSYFPDMSPYAFLKSPASPPALNVGWLDPSHAFRKGPVEKKCVEKLLKLSETAPVNRTRGWHRCPFCSKHPVALPVEGRSISLGSAEIRVRGKGDVFFAAPDMICHYISDHQYQPPDAFLAAVAALENP